MGRDRNANGARARANRAWLRGQGRPCWICRAMGLRGEIDYSLPATHPYSFEVDHLVPVSRGGSLYDRDNIDATHRVCNEWRSNMSVEEVMAHARAVRGDGGGAAPSGGGGAAAGGDAGRRGTRHLAGPIETTRDWWS